MEIRGNKIGGLLSLFFHDHDHNFAQTLDDANKSGDLEGFVFPIDEDRDLSIGRTDRGKGGDLRSFSIHDENGCGFELRDHMVTVLSTKLSQLFRPIPAIRQKVDFTRDRESKGLEHLLGDGDLCLERTASLRSFRMIEFGPEGQKKVLIEQGKEDPLVAKDIGLLSMIPMPGTSWNLFATLRDDRVIHDKKEHGMGSDPQGMKELLQGGLGHFLHGPDVLSKESGETGQRPVKK
jgi:hypothetical protein